MTQQHAIEDPRAKHSAPKTKFEFTNQVQTRLAGPDGIRIPFKVAEKVYDQMQELEQEKRTWAIAIALIQEHYSEVH